MRRSCGAISSRSATARRRSASAAADAALSAPVSTRACRDAPRKRPTSHVPRATRGTSYARCLLDDDRHCAPRVGRDHRRAAGGQQSDQSREDARQSRSRPGGEEAVEAGQAAARSSGRWHGRVRKSPAASIAVREARQFGRVDRAAAQPGLARQQRVDLLLAFLGLERADAIDERPPGLRQRDRARRAAGACSRRAARDRVSRFEPGDVRMAADRAGRRAGRVEQHGVERAPADHGRVGADAGRRPRAQAREILVERASSRSAERSTAITSRARGRELRGLAAGRGAEIGDALARNVAEQPRRQRRGGVLHPPGAFRVSRAVAAPAPCAASRTRAGRQHAAARALSAQPRGVDFTVRSSGGSCAMRLRDRAARSRRHKALFQRA